MDRLISGRYRLEQRLGDGGMAEVWLARDLELDRPVAVKLLNPAADPGRFEREAHAAARLSHPNVCRLYDCGDADGRPFMVLEYLSGETLETRLGAGGPLPDDETRRVATGLAAGLAHAHAHGIVHRDLKPENVLFDTEGTPKIADFGIAGVAGELTLTDAGTILGTAAYISPEQARGERATAASDVYSFGVILYRMLTGRLPFAAASAVELAQLHAFAEAPPIESLRPDVPPDLAGIARAAITREPERRPADGSALLAALTAEPATAATPPPAPVSRPEDQTQLIRPARRRRAGRSAAALTGLLALAAAGVAVAFLIDRGPSEAPAHPPARHTPSGPSGATPTTVGGSVATGRSHPASTKRAPARTSTATQRSSTRATTTAPATTAATTTPTATTAPSTTTSTTTSTATSTTSSTTSTTTSTQTAP
jgi:serine/threonine-protein kinase